MPPSLLSPGLVWQPQQLSWVISLCVRNGRKIKQERGGEGGAEQEQEQEQTAEGSWQRETSSSARCRAKEMISKNNIRSLISWLRGDLPLSLFLPHILSLSLALSFLLVSELAHCIFLQFICASMKPQDACPLTTHRPSPSLSLSLVRLHIWAKKYNIKRLLIKIKLWFS